ncbi:YlqD family protein [Alkalihalobacterium sp. APHAB7]|uniref:YlqD family protein n=1 Tax=Alkalihalobacterium sp. APHAB7 TaxID=3402081 RepID=UPI003AAAFA3B
MKVIKSVAIKQVLTEKRKDQLLNELHFEKEQAVKELEQLKFQLHKKIKQHTSHEQNHTLRSNFQKEIKQREEKLRGIDFKVHQLNKLEIGTELRDGTVESICEVKIGDNWDDIFSEAEIIIKDGIVHEIRKG